MKDTEILDLYWMRSESAISETSVKYGKYCNTIAMNILRNNEDADECVSDTYTSISLRFNMSESKVKSTLFRTRNKLRIYLEKEGIKI